MNSYIITLAISKRNLIGILIFFGQTTYLTESFESLCILVHNNFKFQSVFRAASLEVTNKPATAKILCSNLSRVHFLKREIFRYKKLSAYCSSDYVFVGLIFTSKNVFAVCSFHCSCF